MSWRRRAHPSDHGFSLIELVIVVVIIGVIASVAAYRMSHSVRTSGLTATKNNIARIKQAVELYAAEHDGVYPDANIADQLTQYTDITGTTIKPAKDSANKVVYGPYLSEMPPIMVGANKEDNQMYVAMNAGDAPPASAATGGWWYNAKTHQFRVILRPPDAADADLMDAMIREKMPVGP